MTTYQKNLRNAAVAVRQAQLEGNDEQYAKLDDMMYALLAMLEDSGVTVEISELV